MTMSYEKCHGCEFVTEQRDRHSGLPQYKCRITGVKLILTNCIRSAYDAYRDREPGGTDTSPLGTMLKNEQRLAKKDRPNTNAPRDPKLTTTIPGKL